MTLSASEIIQKSSGNYALPEIYSQLSKKLEDPHATNPQIADIIQLDTGLSSSLLKIVNSAFYGFPSAISTISQDITIIGRKELAELVLGQSVMSAFDTMEFDKNLLREHWQHSLFTGLISKQLCKKMNNAEQSADALFVAGLLHDIGKLVLWQELPEQSKQIRDAVKQENSDWFLTEQKFLGTNHAEVGSELLKEWKLPAVLVDTACHHHQAENTKSSQQAVQIVFIANQLSQLADEAQQSQLIIQQMATLKSLGLTVTHIEKAMEIAKEQLTEMSALFLN